MTTNYLLRQVQIICPASKYNDKTVDIHIRNGVIVGIDAQILVDDMADTTVIDTPNLCVSGGWLDTSANFFDPGMEQKETLHTGCLAAARGGFTAVAVQPTALPTPQTKAQIHYYTQPHTPLAAQILPIAALTINTNATQLTEMIDLHQAGAVAYSNGDVPIENSGIMLRVLQYAQHFGGVVYSQPTDPHLSAHGMVNESPATAHLGLPAIPNIAEAIGVARDIEILRYAGGTLHFNKISTAQSVALIQKARSEGLNITASTTVHHIALTDEAVEDFDTNYKVLPPLRTATDIEALQEALINGTIDCICTDHTPHETDAKHCEFATASYGIIGLETTYALLNSLELLNTQQIVTVLCTNPRKILNQTLPPIDINQKANLTLFDPNHRWKFLKNDIVSRSKNTPFINMMMIGKVVRTFYYP